MKSQKFQSFRVIIVIMTMLAGASVACRFSSRQEPTATPQPTETATVRPTETPVPTATETLVPTATETLEPTATETVSVFDERPSFQLGPEIEIDQIIQVDEETEPTFYEAGDVLSANNQIIMVLGWEILPADDFFAPDPGSMYIAIDVIVVNTNPEPILISSFLQTDLLAIVDGESVDFSISFWAFASIKSHLIDGYVLPGERVRAKIGYEMPEDATDILFGYTPEFLFSDPIWIALENEPGLLNPPAFIPGEIAQPVYSPEGRIEINGLTLIVNNVNEEAGQSFSEPDEGYTYIIADLSLINNSESAITLSSDQFLLKDRTGLRYKMNNSATALGGGNLPDGEYQPGETVQIILGFEIPAYETRPQLIFDATDWDLGKIFVDLVLE
jgi:hypothetical protein